jgi:hypothetical protein
VDGTTGKRRAYVLAYEAATFREAFGFSIDVVGQVRHLSTALTCVDKKVSNATFNINPAINFGGPCAIGELVVFFLMLKKVKGQRF